jgi:phenylalanyl-tRNA synthetase alpha chain
MAEDTENLDTILGLLNTQEALNSLELAQKIGVSHEKIYSMLLSLQSLNIINIENRSENKNEVTPEGLIYIESGSPEYKFGQFVQANPGLNPKQISDKFQEELPKLYSVELPTSPAVLAKAVFGKAKALGFIKPGKSGVQPGDLSEDKTQKTLKSFNEGAQLPAKEITELTKRSLVQKVVINWFSVTKGEKYVDSMSKVKKPVAYLTEDMIKSGEWKNVEFAPLNFDAFGQKIPCGHEHPLLKVRQEFRQIFFQMGFEEMDTSKWIESSFWNFDTLFQGQQHPCRDMHDTFFIDQPEYAKPIEDKDYFLRVKDMHENGGHGSIGLRYNFSDQVPLTNILRTHTTAVSSRTLKMIADELKKTGEIRPHRYFSIDRVYRNETLDATHLAEFHQVEGFVLDKNLSLGHLMNLVREFFSRIGLNDISFKPAYNPYTEPSMEIFAFHPGLNKTIEIGNSGIFRPEMLIPMGIPEEYTVVAWGFSLERPTMIEYGISEIRSLEGPNVSLDLIENVPLCRLTF